MLSIVTWCFIPLCRNVKSQNQAEPEPPALCKNWPDKSTQQLVITINTYHVIVVVQVSLHVCSLSRTTAEGRTATASLYCQVQRKVGQKEIAFVSM